MPNDDIQQLLKLRPNLSAERQKQVDEIVAMYGQQETPFDNLPMSGAIDRFGSRLGQNLEGIYAPLGIGIDETQKELNSGRPVDMTTPLRIGAHGLGRVIHGLAEGVKEQYTRPQTRSINPLVDPGNFGREVLRGATGWVPGGGPQFNDMIDQYQSGDWAGGNADALFGLASIFGPKVMKLVNNPMNSMGRKLYGAAIENPSKMTLSDVRGMHDIGYKNDIIPKEVELGRLKSTITDPGKLNVNRIINDAQNRGVQVPRSDLIGDVVDKYYERLTSARPSSAEPLAKYVDEFENTRFPGMPMVDIADAQASKRATSKLIRDTHYNEGSQAVDMTGPAAGDILAEASHKRTISSAVPEVDSWNRDVHDALNLRNQITKQVTAGPNYWKGITPYLIPMEVGSTVGGLASGNVTAAAGGLAGLLTTAAMRSPVLKARLAIALKYAGTGDISKAISHLPKISQADLEKELHRQDQ